LLKKEENPLQKLAVPRVVVFKGCCCYRMSPTPILMGGCNEGVTRKLSEKSTQKKKPKKIYETG